MSSSEDSDYQEFECPLCFSNWLGKNMSTCEGCGEKICEACVSTDFRPVGCNLLDLGYCSGCYEGIDESERYCNDSDCPCNNHPPEQLAELAQKRQGFTPLTFGKYKGQYLVDLFKQKEGKNYVQWLAGLSTKQNLAPWEQTILQRQQSAIQQALSLLS